MARQTGDWKYWLGTGIVLVLGGLAVIASVSAMTHPTQWLLIAGWTAIVLGLLALLPPIMRLALPVRQWLWRLLPPSKKPPFKRFMLPPDVGCQDAGSAVLALFSSNQRSAHSVKVENPELYGFPATLPKPTHIVFLKPKNGGVIRESDLPSTVRGRRDDMRVTHFISGGFSIDEGKAAADAVSVEIYFDADALAGPRTDDAAYSRWLGSLDNRSQLPASAVVAPRPNRATRLLDEIHRQDARRAEVEASRPLTGDELAPYAQVSALINWSAEGKMAQGHADWLFNPNLSTTEKDSRWRESAERALPVELRPGFRAISDHEDESDFSESVAYLDRAIRDLEARLTMDGRLLLLKRLLRAGRGLSRKAPRTMKFLQSSVAVEFGAWVHNVRDVLPRDWQDAWAEKPYVSGTAIEGVAPDFESALAWLEGTIPDLEAESYALSAKPRGILRARYGADGEPPTVYICDPPATTKSLILENDTDSDIFCADWSLVSITDSGNLREQKTDPFPLQKMQAHTQQVLWFTAPEGMPPLTIRARWKDDPDSPEWREEDWTLTS